MVCANGDSAKIEFFEKKVRPTLAKYCYECHSAKSEKVKGGLLLDTKLGIRKGGEIGPAVVPGDLRESLLLEAIHWKNEDLQMPPKKKLPDATIKVLEAWVRMGAPDPRTGQTVVKEGMRYGATDEHGIKAVEGRMHFHDLHATILHLLGLDHEKLTYNYAGRDFRLTDVYGKVAKKILA